MSKRLALTLVLAVGCHGGRRATTPGAPTTVPPASVPLGACGDPGRDGVVGAAPRLERADRDLDGDGVLEPISVDRAICSADGNCYWNLFRASPDDAKRCARYAGTFAAAALEAMPTAGEDHMRDVRGYWNLRGGRLLLQTYRFQHGGYQLTDVLLCKRREDDQLDCTDADHPGR